MANNDINDRIKSEQTLTRITNNDMVCRNCLLRFDDTVIYGNTSKCEAYPKCKPTKVLIGGKCSEYIKQ